MKHLLSGVSIAAALVIAAPVWAQNAPMTPSGAPKAAAAAAPAAAPAAKHHRPMRHHMARGKRANPNTMANELNREEMSRIQGGGAAPPPPPPAPMTGPRPSPSH